MYKGIVVGTDFSPTAAIATERAAQLAGRLGSDLIIVHAGSEQDRLKDLGKKYKAETVAAPGDPATVLLDAVQTTKSELLVVGSVGMTGAKRFLLGSVPNKVSHHAATDLLIVKTDSPDSAQRVEKEYSKILVGTDGSVTAMRAVDKACQLAKELDATPVIVSVYQPLTSAELERFSGDALAQWHAGTGEVPEEFRWRIAGAEQAQDVLDRSSEHAERVGVDHEVRALEGMPAEVLISVAEEEGFGLIVIGSVGMSGAKRFMLGNVPNRISHHSPTDVLILHTT
ncbi:MAG TPA: universal stress protein [Actinomycetota bacterium]|nr:universal stress protein [Actinomycetota bacterium]